MLLFIRLAVSFPCLLLNSCSRSSSLLTFNYVHVHETDKKQWKDMKNTTFSTCTAPRPTLHPLLPSFRCRFRKEVARWVNFQVGAARAALRRRRLQVNPFFFFFFNLGSGTFLRRGRPTTFGPPRGVKLFHGLFDQTLTMRCSCIPRTSCTPQQTKENVSSSTTACQMQDNGTFEPTRSSSFLCCVLPLLPLFNSCSRSSSQALVREFFS